MYFLCEITSGDVVLCDGCGSDIPEAATDAVHNLVYGFDEEWIDEYLLSFVWQFTKILPEKVKYVPPSWKPSDAYLEAVRNISLQGGADSSARNQV